MSSLYIISPRSFTGKTTLSVGIGAHLQSMGLKVGYLKPFGTPSGEEKGSSRELSFLKKALGTQAIPTGSSSIPITPKGLESLIAQGKDEAWTRLETSYAREAKEKDVLLLEGADGLDPGKIIDMPLSRIASTLKARILLVVWYEGPSSIGDLLSLWETLPKERLGVVINAIPAKEWDFAHQKLVPLLAEKGVRVTGILPQDRIMYSVSARELAELLDGSILNSLDRCDEIVENLMMGAMSIDPAAEYFERKSNKAVITRGDRTDIQLAALRTSTRCLVLTGGMKPSPFIQGRAEDADIPVIQVNYDSVTTAEKIEGVIGHAPFYGDRKLARVRELLDEHLDYPSLMKELGLSAPAS